MADTTISPNMNLPVPVVGETVGPDWANFINACMAILDQHNHTNGSGVPITPDAISMTSQLDFNNQNAVNLRSTRFTAQPATFSLPADVACFYVVGVDVYYRDGNGNNIRITQSGSISGASGTITGLPSGTASASYSVGTFTFESATSTPAAMRHGPLSIGEQVASPNFVTIQSPSALAASYSITLPTGLPAGVRFVTLDASGILSFNSTASTGTGAVVLATSPTITTPTINTPTITTPAVSDPTFSGTISGTLAGSIAAASYTPTVTASFGSVSGSQNFSYIRVNNKVTVTGYVQGVASSGDWLFLITLPFAPTSNFTNDYQLILSVNTDVNEANTVQSAYGYAQTGQKRAVVLCGVQPAYVSTIKAFISFTYDCT